MKLLAIILTLAGALTAAHGLLELPNFRHAGDRASYEESAARHEVLSNLHNWVQQISVYRNEEHIRSGGSSLDEVASYTTNRNQALSSAIMQINERYAIWISTALNTAEMERLIAERDDMLQQERERHAQEIADYQASVISQHLSHYRMIMSRLNEPGSYFYYADLKNGLAISNVGDNSNVGGFFTSLPASLNGKLADGGAIHVGISHARFAQLSEEFAANRQQGTLGVYQTLGGLIIVLLGFGYVLYAAGNRQDAPGVHLTLFDRPYLEFTLLITGMGIFLCGVALAEALRNAIDSGSQVLYYVGGLLVVAATLLLLFAGSVVSKRIKRGELLTHTLGFAVLAGTWRFVSTKAQQLLSTGPAGLRIAVLQAAYAVLTAITVLMVVASGSGVVALLGVVLFMAINALAMFSVLKQVSWLQAISVGVERIKEGDLAHRVSVPGTSILATIAQGVNNIASGLKAAVENEVKSERMKAELITNVSHDLRTPLTSLITYVDLLKNEGLCSENAPKYLDVLDNKSQRLKSLTEDLFEAAKAASGSLSVELEKLDAGSLLSQGLGELADKIEASGLDFRVKMPSERIYVLADGRLLWRVVQNLLSNVFKYALAGSRVYVEVEERHNQVCLTFKNISACALNIDPAELMERFKRGDESRHSEGSGLGLAIAKSLTELQGGEFRVEIDGDLFKATVALPRCA